MRRYFIFNKKKCRIYAAFGVSQTPTLHRLQGAQLRPVPLPGKDLPDLPAVCKGLCIIEFPVFHFCYLIQGHFHIWFRKLQENFFFFLFLIPAARRPITRISTRTAAPAYERVRSFASSFPVFLRKWFPGSPAHKQFFHPAPEACGNPGVPGQHAVGGSAAWGFPASICVFEAKKSPDMRIWRFLVSMFLQIRVTH